MLLIIAILLLIGLLYTDIKSSFYRTEKHPLNSSPKMKTYLSVAVAPWRHRQHWKDRGYMYFILSRFFGLAALMVLIVDIFFV